MGERKKSGAPVKGKLHGDHIINNISSTLSPLHSQLDHLPDSRTTPLSLIMNELMRYVGGRENSDLSGDEQDAIYNLYIRSMYTSYPGNPTAYRTRHFWRWRLVSVVFHLHPDLKLQDITDEIVNELHDRLVRLIDDIFGFGGQYKLGFATCFDQVVINHDSRRIPHHFHVNLLPLRMEVDDYKDLESNPSVFMKQMLSSWYKGKTLVVKQNGKKYKKRYSANEMIEGMWFDPAEDLEQLEDEWLEIQRDVFGIHDLPDVDGEGHSLVDLRKESRNEFFSRNVSDSAKQMRYHHHDLKVEIKSRYKWLPDERMVEVRPRNSGQAKLYHPIEFFRKFVNRPLHFHRRTKGLLHGRSAFSPILDKIALGSCPESLIFWATLPKDWVLWKLRTFGTGLLLHFLKDVDAEAKGRLDVPQGAKIKKGTPDWPGVWCRPIVKYLFFLTNTPPNSPVKKPKGRLQRITLAKFRDMAEQDQEFIDSGLMIVEL